MLAVPPALLDILHLQAGGKVGITIRSGRLVVEANRRPRYTMEELLALCNPGAPLNLNKEDSDCLDANPAGGELL
jgi:antitoxin ChpS